jgi:hypothetical protein
MRIVTILLLVVLSCSAAMSQITVTSTDIQAIYAAGKSSRNLGAYNLSVTMNVGTASSLAQSWQMPTVVYTDTIRMDNMLPSATPYASRFPRATHVQRATQKMGDTTTTMYFYMRITTDSLISLGYAIRTQSSRIDTTDFEPQLTLQYMFPIQVGKTFTRRDSISIFAGAYIIQRTVTTCDAYGTLVTPAGTFQTLRTKAVSYSQTFYPGLSMPPDSSMSITWFTKEGYYYNVEPKDQHQSSGSQIISSVSYMIPLGSTGVTSQSPGVPAEYTLEQNYPNPFNPSTNIRFSVAQAGHVSLKVYNILGVEVASIVNEQKEAGTFSVNWNASGLPSGMYLYRLSVTSDKGQVFDQAKKLVLVK